MADEQQLTLKIKADIEKALKDLAGLRGEVRKLGQSKSDIDSLTKSVNNLSTGLGSVSALMKSAFGALGIGFGLKAIIDETIRAEAALTQIEARIKSTGGAAGFTSGELVSMASALQKTTTFSDEAVLEMQGVLLSFRNVQGDVFRQATEAALNLSVGLGQDLKSSALQLGKALENPVQGLTALRRVGIQFSDDQEALIKNFVRVGDVASAQQIILERVETGFGGAARAARDTLGGALASLKNAFGDLLENKGGLKETKAALEDLIRVLQDPQTAAAVENITTVVIRGLGQMAQFVTAVHFLIKGPSDDIGKLDAMIDKVDQKIRLLRASLEGPRILRGTGFGPGNFADQAFESDASLNKKLAALLAEREKLIQQLDTLQRQRGAEILKAQGVKPAAVVPETSEPPPPSEEFEKALADIQRRIALLDKEKLAEQVLYEIEHGRYADLADNEQRALLAAARRFDASQELLNFEKEARADLLAQIDAEEKQNAEMAKFADRVRDVIDPSRALYRELAQINELFERGIFSPEEFLDATLNVQQRIADLGEKTKETTNEMTEFAREAARGMQSSFADEFFSIFEGKTNDLGEAFSRLLHRMAAELAASQLLKFLTGDYGTTGKLGGVLAGIFHGGGTVGAGGSSRRVPALTFAGAPRLHSGTFGLSADEMPAILQRGEQVLSRDQLRAGGGGPVKVTIENRGTPQQVVESQATLDPEGMIVNVVVDDVRRGGPVSTALARAFNLRRGG